jgi:hypothetical protein
MTNNIDVISVPDPSPVRTAAIQIDTVHSGATTTKTSRPGLLSKGRPDWPVVNREVTFTLDDVLIEDGSVAPFSRSETTYTVMGRFGNVMLVNGEPELSCRRGDSPLPHAHPPSESSAL